MRFAPPPEATAAFGIHTVHQLLGVPAREFRYLTGVGRKVRREIRERAKRFALLRPDLVPGGIVENDGGRASVDRLADQLVARRPAGDDKPEDRVLARYLGIEPEGAPQWPHAGAVALAVGTAPAAASGGGAERWHKSPDLYAVRGDLDGLIEAAGGVASVDELAAQLLAARGSVQEDARHLLRNRPFSRAAFLIDARVRLRGGLPGPSR